MAGLVVATDNTPDLELHLAGGTGQNDLYFTGVFHGDTGIGFQIQTGEADDINQGFRHK